MTEKSCFAGKFGAFFASIPLPIFAAIYCILYGIVGKYFLISDTCYHFSVLSYLKLTGLSLSPSAATGISFIQFTNNNSMRNIYVLGVSLFLGISIPQYFILSRDAAGNGPVRTEGRWVIIMLFFF